jgi:AcrR family transcriptional regulator
MSVDLQPTKERILAAASRLFAERGYDGMPLRTIAAEGGAPLALLHFADEQIRDHVVNSFHMERDELNMASFDAEDRADRMSKLFGE